MFGINVRALGQEVIVDTVIWYDCQTSGETYLLVVRNALYVPTMVINLIPSFILREAGLVLNDTPKIHRGDPSVENHSIFDEETGLRIQFTLNGTFSIFSSCSLMEDKIENVGYYPTIFLTPDSDMLDPYDES